MEELVSVIVPVYNTEAYLPRCLECISNQTYKNLEIILVDDGSTDSSGRLCDEYSAKDPRARVIHHPKNTGLWAARNTGQDAATGEYLWFPDADDFFHKDIIRIMHEAINQTGSDGKKYDLAIVGGEQTERMEEDIDSKVEPGTFEVTTDELLSSITWRKSIKQTVIPTTMWNKLFRVQLITDVQSNDYRYAQDIDFNLRVFLKEPKTVCVGNVLYWWFQWPLSAMHQSDYYSVRSKCQIQFSFNIFKSLQGNELRFRHFFLDIICNWMPLQLELARGTEGAKEVKSECRQIFRTTWYQYLFYSERPLYKRIKRLLRIAVDLFRL